MNIHNLQFQLITRFGLPIKKLKIPHKKFLRIFILHSNTFEGQFMVYLAVKGAHLTVLGGVEDYFVD